jgi:glutaredoxin
MNLTLVTTNNCSTCKRVEAQMKQFVSRNKNVNLDVVNIKDYKQRGISIAPALLIDDELFAYGDIDENKLLAKLKLSSFLPG